MPTAASTAKQGVADLPAAERTRLIARIDAIPLFAHAYSWHLNFRLGTAVPSDLLHWAASHQLCGVKIHVEDGEARSLLHDPASRGPFAALARKLGLAVHIETSSTEPGDLRDAIAIARDTGATSVRCYPRHAGPLSAVIARTIADLKGLATLDPAGTLGFRLEQHEDLTSRELVHILKAVANPRLTLLYDFANMVNANETPETALAVMAPHVTDVHIKDARILPDRGGRAHRACRSGEGDIGFHGLLATLLLLGEDAPQVRAFALEEENDMYAPAYRFPGEGPDPLIPARGPSVTDLPPGEAFAHRLDRERREADAQIAYVRRVLAELRSAAGL